MKKLLTTLLLLAALGCKEEASVVDASGVFEATEVLVSAETSGKIVKLEIEEGAVFSEGQVAAYLDSAHYLLNRQQLMASKEAVLSGLPNIEVQIETIRQDIKRLESEKERVERLVKGDVATQKQLDDIRAQIAVLQARLASQQSMLHTTTRSIYAQSKTIDSQIAVLEDQLRRCVVKNPVSGTILTTYARQGEITSMGKPLYRIADLEKMHLRAYVTGDQLSSIRLGQKVKVLAEYGAEGHREYEGTIQWISEKSEFTPKTVQTQDERANLVYAVKIAVKNDGQLKIGMYGGIILGAS